VTVLIRIEGEALIAQLDRHGWTQQDWVDDDGRICSHQAVRLCSPLPGNDRIILAVAARQGWGPNWNDAVDPTRKEPVMPKFKETTRRRDVDTSTAAGVVRGQRGLGMGGHHAPTRGAKDEWLTPPPIIEALGPFDLDPCAPVVRPWPTAAAHLTIEDDGLTADWPPEAFVWAKREGAWK